MSVRRVLRVFAASLLIVLGFVIQAQAQSITGGCTATLNGRTPQSLTEKDPLPVKKDEQVVLTGGVPAGVEAAGDEIESTTDIYVDVFGFPVKVRTADGTGPTWGGSAELPELVRDLAAGIYRVSGEATGTGGWECSGSGYIELEGNALAKPTTYLAAVIAGGGGALVAGARKASADKAGGKAGKKRKGKETNGLSDLKGALGADAAALALALALLLLAGPLVALAAPLAVQNPGSGATWVRGRPIRGFFGGLLFALGLAVVLQQFGFAALDSKMGLAVLASAVVFAVRAWMGMPYKSNPEAPQPPVSA